MTDSKEIEGKLYRVTYGGTKERNINKRNQIWKEIKEDKELPYMIDPSPVAVHF